MFISAVVGTLGLVSAPTGEAAPATWNSRPRMPTARNVVVGVTADDRFYVIEGCVQSAIAVAPARFLRRFLPGRAFTERAPSRYTQPHTTASPSPRECASADTGSEPS